MIFFLWFATWVITNASQDSSYLLRATRRQTYVEDVNKIPLSSLRLMVSKKGNFSHHDHGIDVSCPLFTIACSNTFDQERNQLIEEAECAVREVYLGLAPPAVYNSIAPETLWVKRCVGSCLFSEGSYTCRPSKVVRRNLPINFYDVRKNTYHCSSFVLEEHEECHCDDPKSTCTPVLTSLDVDAPNENKVVHPGVNPGVVHIRTCSGNCSNYDSTCTAHKVVLKEVETARGNYSAEDHDSCLCDPEHLTCLPRDTYIDLPTNYESVNPQLDAGTFLTKRCFGDCHGMDYQCLPLKVIQTSVYNTTWKVEEHISCLCMKKK